MKEIYLDIREWDEWLKKRFFNKDFISLDELLESYEELIDEVDYLKEKIEDMEQDIQDNYKPIPVSEQVGISDSDFI